MREPIRGAKESRAAGARQGREQPGSLDPQAGPGARGGEPLVIPPWPATEAGGPSSHGGGPGTYVVGVAVGAVETHSAEGVARNGSRHDGKLQSPIMPRGGHAAFRPAPLSGILGNEVLRG